MRFLLPLLLALALPAAAATTPASPAPWGTGESRGEDLSVKVVTFGPGDDVTEWFGHGAIVVEDKRLGQSRLYNYGEYSFDETMVRRYLMGHLEFTVGERPVARTLDLYAAHDRDVRLQELALSPAQKEQLGLFLAENVKPENKRYLYDHYADNCTTRVRDAVDKVTGGALLRQSQPGTRTLRQLTREKTAVSPLFAFLIDVVLNDSTDAPLSTWQEAFLPEEFEQQLARATITVDGETRPLVSGTATHWKSTRGTPPQPPSSLFFAAVGAVPAALLLLLRRRSVVVGLVVAALAVPATLLGSVLFAMAFFTDHHVTWGNQNLLLVSPLHALLVPAGLLFASGRQGALRVVSVVVAGAAVVAVVAGIVGAQDTTWALLVFVPFHLATALVAWRARRG